MRRHENFTLLKDQIAVLENTISTLAEELGEVNTPLSVKKIKRLAWDIAGVENGAGVTLTQVEASYKANWIDDVEYAELYASLSLLLNRATQLGLKV